MEFVGVKSFSELITASLEGQQILKREALLFDRIGLPDLNLLITNKNLIKGLSRNVADFKWLLEKGIVFDPNELLRGRQLVITEEAELYHQAYHARYEVLRKMERKKRRTEKLQTEFLTYATQTYRIDSLLTSLHLRHKCGLDAYPIFYQSSMLPELNATSRSAVQIVLKALPIPDEVTAWEQIDEFRSDPDSRSKFLDLRGWMNEVAKAELTPIEIEQKLEHLIDQYQRHIQFHKMKSTAGIVETVVVSAAELLEDTIKFRWGKIAKDLFSLRQKKIALLEGELTAPGREVAYIIKAKKNFNG